MQYFLFQRYMTKHTHTFILLLLFFLVSPLVSADIINIGLRAHHGIDKSMAQWKLTADYLSEKIPEHQFVMVPLVGLTELMAETEKDQFDFVITNPSSYVEMELRFGASSILTLRNKRQGKPYTKFGAVIFTRKDRQDINTIRDIENKRIVAVSERAFGGWRVAWREMLKEGFDPYKKAGHVSFSGGIQQDVVNIVGLGNADVGVVRTDMLERMANEKLIKLNDFKIINPKITKDFPFLHSTELYPEWPFVKMNKTSEILSKKVALALLTIPSDHPAAIAGKYVGWTVPEDYQPVHNLMKQLKVGPYVNFHGDESELEHFLEQYGYYILVVFLALLALVIFSTYVLSLNRKILNAKAEVDKLNNELEFRVEQRTEELLIAKNHAEVASQAKSEFLSRMSHELRTPLNAVLGFAQIIEIDIKELQQPELSDNIQEILHAGRYLLELINDVLDLSKIEAGNYELDMKAVSISKIINATLNLLQAQATDKKVTLSSKVTEDNDLQIYADARSLKQIMINLIYNAIKYNHPGGSVDVSIEKQTNGICKISVTDTGDGIAEDAQQRIFDPFQRVTNRTDIEGTGVGLAIVDSLVKIMGGRITLESTPGKGSTFSVFFTIA